MKEYLALMRSVLDGGKARADRTGTGVFSIFGTQSRYDLSKGFPLLTTKKIHFKSVLHELLWFLRGGDNIGYLNKHQVHIWDNWARKDGSLGRIYGVQWRSWRDKNVDEIDQIKRVIHDIKSDPYSRRLVVSAWNVAELPDMVLPPCHVLFQFYVDGGRLSCQLYQRSADVFLGVPFNIASYSLLTLLIAKICGLQAGEFIHTIGDAHLYKNHVEQAKEQLNRRPKPLPSIKIDDEVNDIDDLKLLKEEYFTLENYHPHPHIKAEIAV